MKTNKIQVSTVRKTANVQVIELNAAFVARVVEARFEAKRMIDRYDDKLANESLSPCGEFETKINLDSANLLSNLLEDIYKAFVANDEQDDDQDCEASDK